MPQRCKMFQFNWTQEMSEYLNWHESDPRKIRFIRCLMCGDNGIQLILWWIKIGNKNWVKCLVVDYCIITVDIFWILLPITVTRMCISLLLAALSFSFFPRISFHCALHCASFSLHKSREINFVKTWCTILTQWMVLRHEHCVLSEDIYQASDQRSGPWGQEMVE